MKNKISRNQSIGSAAAFDELAESPIEIEDKKEDDALAAICEIIVSALNNLSNSIEKLATATTNQKPPIVINLIANNDEDLNKFSTIFKQEIK